MGDEMGRRGLTEPPTPKPSPADSPGSHGCPHSGFSLQWAVRCCHRALCCGGVDPRPTPLPHQCPALPAALAVHGRKREPPDRPAPRPAKALKTAGMLSVDAAVDTSDSDD